MYENSTSILGLAGKNSPTDTTARYERIGEEELSTTKILPGVFVARVGASAVERIHNTMTTPVTSDVNIIGVATPNTGDSKGVDITMKGLHIPVISAVDSNTWTIDSPIYIDVLNGWATNTDGAGANILLVNARVSGVEGDENVNPPVDINGKTPEKWVYIDLT